MKAEGHNRKVALPIRPFFIFPLTFLLLFLSIQTASAAPERFSAPPSLAPLADEVKDAVVNISTTQVVRGRELQPFMGPESPFRDFFGDEFFKRFFDGRGQREFKTHSLGSGLVISPEGYILTNNHVVEKATEIKIKLMNGDEYDARIIGRDPKTDLALIQVDPRNGFPKPAVLGDSAALRVGDWLMAVGNPFGLGHTVTVGILSATGRVIGAGPYDDFLQTDAAINPGNSGGPLFDMQGRVVGINTAIVAQGQGIGFAIPINLAKDLLPQLKEGKITRGWLGVVIQDLTPELAKSFGLEEAKGVLISDIVADSPAGKAGLREGDVIRRFNGNTVETAHDLSRMVAGTAPDTEVRLDIIRGGKPQTVPVTLGILPDEATQPETESSKEESAWGMTLQNVTPELAERFGWAEREAGVVISNVEEGSPAAEAGLRGGDLIKELNRQPIQNLEAYNRVMRDAKDAETLLLLVKRGERTFFVVVKK
jgi:serine protease Do